jgi:hypothetical protein
MPKPLSKSKKTARTSQKTKPKDWVTYRVGSAIYKLNNNDEAHGGQHLYQIKFDGEVWLHRCLAKNGDNEEAGPVTLLTESQGESKFASYMPPAIKKKKA